MRILFANANLLANAKSKSKFKILPANLSSTIFHRFLSTTAAPAPAPAPALSPNLKQHENTNKNLMLMMRVLNKITLEHCVISTENNSFRVVQDTPPKLRSQNFYTDYFVRACSNHKWMLLTCRNNRPRDSYELLWDPATDEAKPLPNSIFRPFPVFTSCWGFGVGFDPRESGDYKVVRSHQILQPGLDFRIRSEVLSLRTGSSKEIPYPCDPKFQPIEELALHINGFYYWPASHRFEKKLYAIIPFDFANEKFLPDLIPMPVSKKLRHNVSFVLAEFHGSLAAVVYDFKERKKNPRFEIWVWRNDNWSCVDEFEVPDYCGPLHVIIGLYKNDKVLIQDSNGDLLLYDCETRSVKDLDIYQDSFDVRVYPYGKPTVNNGDKLVAVQKDNGDSNEKLEKFEKMKLAELKEIAKSKGIKGYSKLERIDLVELLTNNGV